MRTMEVMCRYAEKEYKTRRVCLTCRVAFKNVKTCPNCATKLTFVGKNFQTPKRTNTTAWKAVEATLNAGLNYDSCGCGSTGVLPKTSAEVKRIKQEASTLILRNKNRKGKPFTYTKNDTVSLKYLGLVRVGLF